MEEEILHTPEPTIYSVYARTDKNGRVVKVFSNTAQVKPDWEGYPISEIGRFVVSPTTFAVTVTVGITRFSTLHEMLHQLQQRERYFSIQKIMKPCQDKR